MNQVMKGLVKERVTRAKTQDVLKKIRANYEAHKRAHAEAVEGYKLELRDRLGRMEREFEAAVTKKREELAAAVARTTSGIGSLGAPNPPTVEPGIGANLLWTTHFGLRPPVSHAADYEVIIEMLAMSVEDEVDMTTAEVEAYCMDRFAWADEFRATNAFYAESVKNFSAKK